MFAVGQRGHRERGLLRNGIKGTRIVPISYEFLIFNAIKIVVSPIRDDGEILSRKAEGRLHRRSQATIIGAQPTTVTLQLICFVVAQRRQVSDSVAFSHNRHRHICHIKCIAHFLSLQSQLGGLCRKA